MIISSHARNRSAEPANRPTHPYIVRQTSRSLRRSSNSLRRSSKFAGSTPAANEFHTWRATKIRRLASISNNRLNSRPKCSSHLLSDKPGRPVHKVGKSHFSIQNRFGCIGPGKEGKKNRVKKTETRGGHPGRSSSPENGRSHW